MGWLHTHFFDGTTTVPEFLRGLPAAAIDGLYLEVISPYFDAGPESKPLSDLIAEFGPKEVRVFLPGRTQARPCVRRSYSNGSNRSLMSAGAGCRRM